MKNGIIIWNVILSLVAALLLFLQFGPRKNNKSSAENKTKDSTTVRQFSMAYFEMDSVEANFNLVKEVKAEINTREIEYNNSLSQIKKEFDDKLFSLQQKAPTMTQEQQDAAGNELKKLQESAEARKQDLGQKFQDFVMHKNLDIKKKIEDYLRVYNNGKNYSYIISYEQGLFYLKDTAYNITADIVNGLNTFYKKANK